MKLLKWIWNVIVPALMLAVIAGALALLLPMIAVAQSPDVNPPGDNINVQYWQVITGFVLPLVLSVIIQSGWSRAAQALAAFAFSVVVTVLQLWIYGQLDGFTDSAQAVLMVFASSIVFYQGFWKPTGVAPAIEEKTSGSG